MYIGELIKIYRKQHGLSMQDFSNISGISKAYIGLLEKIYNPATKEPIAPSLTKIQSIANAMGIELDDLLKQLDDNQPVIVNTKTNNKPNLLTKGVRIPILGKVMAGIPITAITDIDGYEEITEKMAKSGTFFALRVKGNSMEPELRENDIVIVRSQEDIESGNIAIVMVNGDEVTIKKVLKSSEGVTLIGYNVSVYPPHFYTNKQINDLPVKIIGRVSEIRRTV